MTQWTSRFSGSFDGRQVEILVYGDKESFKVKTTQKDHFADASNALVISAGDSIDIEEETLPQLLIALQENGFSEGHSRQVCRLAQGEDEPRRYALHHRGQRIEVSGTFGSGVFQVLRFAPGASRMVGAADSDQPHGATALKSIQAHNHVALAAEIDRQFPGHSDFGQF